jgi:hypothetical protein
LGELLPTGGVDADLLLTGIGHSNCCWIRDLSDAVVQFLPADMLMSNSVRGIFPMRSIDFCSPTASRICATASELRPLVSTSL